MKHSFLSRLLLFLCMGILFLSFSPTSTFASTSPQAKTNTTNAKGEITQIFCGVPVAKDATLAENVVYPDSSTCSSPPTMKTVLYADQNTDTIEIPISDLPKMQASAKTGYSTMSIAWTSGRTVRTTVGLNGIYGTMSADLFTVNPPPSVATDFVETSITPGGNSCSEVGGLHQRASYIPANRLDNIYFLNTCTLQYTLLDLRNATVRAYYTANFGTGTIFTAQAIDDVGNLSCTRQLLYNFSTGWWEQYGDNCGTNTSADGFVGFYGNGGNCYSITPHQKVINLTLWKLGAWRIPAWADLVDYQYPSECSDFAVWSRTDSINTSGYQAEWVTP